MTSHFKIHGHFINVKALLKNELPRYTPKAASQFRGNLLKLKLKWKSQQIFSVLHTSETDYIKKVETLCYSSIVDWKKADLNMRQQLTISLTFHQKMKFVYFLLILITYCMMRSKEKNFLGMNRLQ